MEQSLSRRLEAMDRRLNGLLRKAALVAVTLAAMALALMLLPYCWPFVLAFAFSRMLEPFVRMAAKGRIRLGRKAAAALGVLLLFGVAGALAAALVIAVYLNWQYARADITPQTEDDTLMVSAEPVEAEAETAITDALPTEAEAASGVNKNYGEAQLVSVANDSGTRFFEQARLKREKAHDEAMDTLQKSLKSSSLTAEEKKEYTAQMAAGLEDLNVENEIETLVRAKGFADCLCFLQAGRADLTVMTAGEPLTAAQVAQIRDVVMNKSSVTAQNITVVEVK